MLFILIGLILTSWAFYRMKEEGTNVGRVIMFIIGLEVILFGLFCTSRVSIYCREKESPKTEITTSISPQIDTVITIRNSVSDTSYIYKFNPKEQ